MPSIADATRARRDRTRRRLLTGVGLLLAGALLVGLGAAGAASGLPVVTEVLVGGLAVWGALLVMAVRAPLGERERGLTAVGAAVGLAGLLAFWALAPPGTVSVLALLAGLGFLLGLTVVLAAVLAAASLPGPVPRSTGPSSVSWTRTAESPGSGSRATDGGETADAGPADPQDDDR